MKKSKKEKLSALEEIATRLPQVKARCKYFGECGGCLLQNLAYADQIFVKRELVNKFFAAQEILWPDGRPVKLKTVTPSPAEWYYRNRMDYPVGENAEIGLKPFGKWRDVLDLKECFLLSLETPEILQLVRDWMRKWNLPGWNNKRYTGYVRYLVLREGKRTGERLVMVVTAAEPAPAPEVWVDLVKRLERLATTIIHGVNARITDISIPAEFTVLKGAPHFNEIVNGHTYKIAPASFFQTNTAGAELLQQQVCAAVTGTRVLDLYCGLGFFAIDLAAQGKEVLGVEIDTAAIDLAKENAAANNCAAQFLAAPVEDWIKQGGSELVEKFNPETMIIDPPRAGLHPRVVDWLVERGAPELIYVSCNYEQWAREYVKLKTAYDLQSVVAVDLFPHTPHIELVTRFLRKK